LQEGHKSIIILGNQMLFGKLIGVGPNQPIEIRRFMCGEWPILGLKVLFLRQFVAREYHVDGAMFGIPQA
jgi:hypothetical protein